MVTDGIRPSASAMLALGREVIAVQASGVYLNLLLVGCDFESGINVRIVPRLQIHAGGEVVEADKRDDDLICTGNKVGKEKSALHIGSRRLDRWFELDLGALENRTARVLYDHAEAGFGGLGDEYGQ
jgi:hypothetical protein